MSGRLPETVNWERLAESGETLRGNMALRGMARLANCLALDAGVAEVELEFGIDAQKIRYLRGHVHATLHVVCQRCLQPFEYPLDVDLNLGLSRSYSEAENMPEGYEPCVCEERTLELKAIVEDELMLALPIVPMHAPDRCQIDAIYAAVQEPEQPRETETRRPFAGLDKLMKSTST